MADKIVNFLAYSIDDRDIEDILLCFYEQENKWFFIYWFQEWIWKKFEDIEKKLFLLQKFKYIDSFRKLGNSEIDNDLKKEFKKKYRLRMPFYEIETRKYFKKLCFLNSIRLTSHNKWFKQVHNNDWAKKISEIKNKILSDVSLLNLISTELNSTDRLLFKDVQSYKWKKLDYILEDLLFFIFWKRKRFLNKIYAKFSNIKSNNRQSREEVELLPHLIYVKKSWELRNTDNGAFYKCKEPEKMFLDFLVKAKDYVKCENIEKKIKDTYGVLSWLSDIKWNLMKALRNKKVLDKKDDFIHWESKSYILVTYLK